jgi:peptide/nickel transport system substrate-binding protein
MPISFRVQAAAALLGLASLFGILAAGAGRGDLSPPRPGDTYVEAMVGTPRLVNPLLASSDVDVDLAHLVYSGLMRVDALGDLAPDLASGWQVSPDSRVYTFTLRPDARWHDDKPLTSDDIVFTLDLLRDKDFPGDAALAAPWKDVQVGAPTTRTVTFTLPAPDASFLQLTTLGILPRHLWSEVKVSEMADAEMNTVPTGSGPWRYARNGSLVGEASSADDPSAVTLPTAAQSPEGVLLEPNPQQWRSAPRISHLWFRSYPTFGAALTGFKMGEVHGLGHIPAERMEEVQVIAGASIHQQTLARYAMLILNTRSPLLDKPETRQAIELAIDKESLAAESLRGQGRALASPVLSHSWAYDPARKYRGYDPAEAGRLLNRAGWVLPGAGGIRAREGVTLSLVLTADKDVPASDAVARQLKSQLGEVGIDVQLALVARERLLSDYLAPRAFHMVLATWQAQGADPDVFNYWHSSQANAPGLNFSGWNNAAADRALLESRTNPDKATRAARYRDFQQAFAQDAPGVILYSPLYTYATRGASGVTLPSTDLLSPAARFDTAGEWHLGADVAP